MQSSGYDNYFLFKQSPRSSLRSAAGCIPLLHPNTSQGQWVLRCTLAGPEELTLAVPASLGSAPNKCHQTSRGRCSPSFGSPQRLLFRWPKGGLQSFPSEKKLYLPTCCQSPTPVSAEPRSSLLSQSAAYRDKKDFRPIIWLFAGASSELFYSHQTQHAFHKKRLAMFPMFLIKQLMRNLDRAKSTGN